MRDDLVAPGAGLTVGQMLILAALLVGAVTAILVIACMSIAGRSRRIDDGLDVVLDTARDRDLPVEPGPELVPTAYRFFVSHYGERYHEVDEHDYLSALRLSGYVDLIRPDAGYGGGPVPPGSPRVAESFHGNGVRGYTLLVPADIPVSVIAEEAVRTW